jgi:pyruvate dehydrogenase E2 component (dihydrolipoamide acetyltransferase)
MKVCYTVEGDGKTPLLALPGLPGSVRDFRWLAPALSNDFCFYRLEPPGYGESERIGAEPMSVAERGDVVRAMMDHVGLDRCHLVGHSAGSIVAAEVANRWEERVISCVFLASPGPTAHYPVKLYRTIMKVAQSAAGRAVLRPVLRFLYARLGFPSYLSDDERLFTTIDASVQDFDRHRGNLASMRQPALVFWAADDPLIPASISELVAPLIRNAEEIRFDTGGHNIQKTRAVEIADELAQRLIE